ncbi:hypothetical protein PBI_DEWDROP_75 [Microbacterium phage Dewdrop]|nr:hypothetical protein PBI_LEAF_75 [Microbacterium phage Leaf]QGZ17443.1 hypothetical protein PBI_DEWDROP_75 [Microbacterium phage Dewdrop]
MTLRYGQIALQHWADLDGYAVGHNMPNLRSLPLDRFCNWLWWMLTRNSNEQEREKTRAKLWRPPPSHVGDIDKRSPWSAENEMKAFSALKQQLMPSVPKAGPGNDPAESTPTGS